MKTSLRVLVVEDSEFDAQIMVTLLRKGGYDVSQQRVENAEDFRAALKDRSWQLILADYNLPTFSAPAALEILRESGIDIPFIIVSGGIGEDIAVASMKAGAHDYLMKGNLQRLAPAVERELREAANRASQREAKQAVIESELRYRLLWETCPDAVLLVDPDGCVRFANPAVKAVFGHSVEEISGRQFSLLLPERLRTGPLAGFERFLGSANARSGVRTVETAGRRKDGVEVPIEVSFGDMMWHGQPRLVTFIRDITARKQAERELLEHEEQFRVAREIQQRLFPKTAPACAGFDIAGGSFPAEATGGDYFDYLHIVNGRVGLVVGDVTGHGIGPALLMAETRAYLRVLAGRREDPGEILTRANGILAGDMSCERFITLFLGCLDVDSRTLIYSSAGHPPAYVLDAAGNVKAKLKRTGIPLGMREDFVFPSAVEIQLAPGDLFLVLTDGLDEATSPDGETFGTERIFDLVRQHRDEPAQSIVQRLYQGVRAFSHPAPQVDDITAIVVKVTGGA